MLAANIDLSHLKEGTDVVIKGEDVYFLTAKGRAAAKNMSEQMAILMKNEINAKALEGMLNYDCDNPYNADRVTADLVSKCQQLVYNKVKEHMNNGYYSAKQIQTALCDFMAKYMNNKEYVNWLYRPGFLGMQNWITLTGGALLAGTIIYFAFFRK